MENKFRRWRQKVEGIPYPAVRIGIGIAMLLGGVLWFLPVLGIWMVPLGIAVLAIDIPWMRPINRGMRRWIKRGLNAMQQSSIGWIRKLGSTLAQPISTRRRRRSEDEQSLDDEHDSDRS